MTFENYAVGYQILTFNLNEIPAWALSDPLTDAWDHIPCIVCDRVFYRLGLETHLLTHRYKEPLWLRILKWMMTICVASCSLSIG